MDTKKLRQKILDLAIHGKLIPQDPNDEPASVLLERIRSEKERLIKEGKIKRSRKTTKTSDAACDKQEVPFEVPNGWVWCRLGEVNDIARGGSPRPIKDYLTNSKNGVNWIKIGDTTKDGKYINSVKEKIRVEGVTKSRMVHKGDFLLTNSMSFGRPYILNVDGCIHDGWLVISPIGKVYSSDFLYYLLSSSFALNQFTQVASGGVVSNLNSDKVADTMFPIAPLAEQQRIVEEIERWFKLIDIIEQGKADLQTTIKQAKNKILDLAIHGKLVPQDPNDEPASELLKRINPKAEITCDNGHYPKLPKGWCLCKLKNISLIITGSTPSKSNSAYYGGKVPFYKPADLDAGRFVDSSAEYLSEAGKAISRVVPIGSTAVCCIGSIGKVGYLIKEGTTNQQINCVIPSEAVESVFLYYLCTSPLFYQELITLSSAVTISIINKSKMENIIVPLPPIEEQKRIVSKIEDLFGFIKTIEESL